MKELIRAFLRFLWRTRNHIGPKASLNTDKKVAFILLSYKREQNIDTMLRAAAKCDFIDRIIVSNNNPEIDIRQHISLADPRLEIINQAERKRPTVRWELAQSETPECDIVVCPDDDIFLYPEQIKKLVQFAIDDPERSHGVVGSIDAKYVSRHNTECDFLMRCYVTTQQHIKRYFELTEQIPFYQENGIILGDDMIISLSAPKAAKIHKVGYILSCKTSMQDKIAIYTEDFFCERRAIIYEQAKKARLNLF